MDVIKSYKSVKIIAPIKNGANLFQGTMLIAGATNNTNLGVLVVSGTGLATGGQVGVLDQLFNFSASGDALVDGSVSWWNQVAAPASGNTALPQADVELFDTGTIASVDYSLASADSVPVASSTSTVVTITSLETNLGSGFLYATVGTGIGQLEFIKTGAAGSATITSAMTTTFDNTTKVIKILPLFNSLSGGGGNGIVWVAGTATAPTKMGSTAAAGAGRGVIVERFIERAGAPEPLDPVVHHNLQSLNGLAHLRFFNHVQLQDTIWHPLQ